MTPRTRLVPVAALSLAGLALLAACGTTHPGAAAVVEGTRIEINDVDQAAAALCSAQPAQQVADSAQARAEVLQTYIARLVVRDLAEDEGVEVPRSDWVLTAAQREQVREVAGDDAAVLVDFIEAQQEAAALAEALGADVADRIEEAAADVDVDPRFELGDVTADLSAGAEDGDPVPVPETQLCG